MNLPQSEVLKYQYNFDVNLNKGNQFYHKAKGAIHLVLSKRESKFLRKYRDENYSM